MKTATLVMAMPPISDAYGTVTQQLFKLSEPVTETPRWDGDDEPPLTFDHIIVSQSNKPMFGINETFVFPANAGGNILNWSERGGSTRGIYPHQEIADAFCHSLTY